MNHPAIDQYIWDDTKNCDSPRLYRHVIFARNWNIARIIGMGGGDWSSPPRIERDYKTEHNIHRKKRIKYVKRCIQDIEKMPTCRKTTLLLSERDITELSLCFKLNNIHILNSEPYPKSKKPRLNVTIVKESPVCLARKNDI